MPPMLVTDAVNTGYGLVSPSSSGPWTPSEFLDNGGNSEPVFLPNGTLYFVSAGGVHCVDPTSGKETGLCPKGCKVRPSCYKRILRQAAVQGHPSLFIIDFYVC